MYIRLLIVIARYWTAMQGDDLHHLVANSFVFRTTLHPILDWKQHQYMHLLFLKFLKRITSYRARRRGNVVSKSMQLHNVASTLMRCFISDTRPLVWLYNPLQQISVRHKQKVNSVRTFSTFCLTCRTGQLNFRCAFIFLLSYDVAVIYWGTVMS